MRSPGQKSQKKRQLTQADKSNIRLFHENNPLVTHTHIAAFFGVDRSTVSKILGRGSSSEPQELQKPSRARSQQKHQTQHQTVIGGAISSPNFLQYQGDEAGTVLISRPTRSHRGCRPQNSVLKASGPVSKALKEWAQQQQREGKRVTQAMIRQKAATLAAMTWESCGLSSGEAIDHCRGEQTSYQRSDPPGLQLFNNTDDDLDTFGRSNAYSGAGYGPTVNLPDANRYVDYGSSSSWLGLDKPSNNDVIGAWNTLAASDTTFSSETESSAPSGAIQYNSDINIAGFDGIIPGAHQFPTQEHMAASRSYIERKHTADAKLALDLIQTALDHHVMDCFDFLCIEHLRERLTIPKY